MLLVGVEAVAVVEELVVFVVVFVVGAGVTVVLTAAVLELTLTV